MIAIGHSYHDLMWTYSIATVHHFYSLAVKKQHRDLSKLAGILQLVGYTAKDLDKKGNTEVSRSWKNIFQTMNRVADMDIASPKKSIGASVSAANKKKLEKAKENPQFLQESDKKELRPIITETGSSVANVFLKTGSPVAF